MRRGMLELSNYSARSSVYSFRHFSTQRHAYLRRVPQGETLEPGVAMQKVQEEAETTLGMLAFDAFPRFLKSKYSKAVMDDLKTGSNPNEVRTNYSNTQGWMLPLGGLHCSA